MSAGAWSVRHWRGMLLGMWLATLAVFASLAWWGFANRDRAWGSMTATMFGLIAIAMIFRFPKRLVRAMWTARRRGPARTAPPGTPPGGIIDTEGTVRPRPSRPLPPRGSTRP